MKLVKLLIVLFCFAGVAFAQNGVTYIEVSDDFDFKSALDYVQAPGINIDTIKLTSSGGVYTTTDTLLLEIFDPLVIMAKEDLAEKPIFTNSDPDSSVLEIFRIQNDVTFDGVVFDGGHAESHGMKYALRVGHSSDPQQPPGAPRHYVKENMNLTIKNCDFRNIYRDKLPSPGGGEGHALYFLRPATGEPTIKAGTILIENCTFYDLGYEAIRMAETEKYTIERVCDSLIVRNCSFSNIEAECVRFYGDIDVETPDAYVLLEHITVDRSATRFAYLKNSNNTHIRDIIVTNSRLSEYRTDRNGFIIQVQLEGSDVSHIDTLNIALDTLIPDSPKIPPIEATKGASVDTLTIWGFDPRFADAENRDYTLLPGSPAYGKAYSGLALGDLRWANPEFSAIDGDAFGEKLPEHFSLEQNYPNPFNPSTTINYTISKPTRVKLLVYNLAGQLVGVLENAIRQAGTYSVTWEPENLASGIYFYRLDVDNQTFIRKMAFIK